MNKLEIGGCYFLVVYKYLIYKYMIKNCDKCYRKEVIGRINLDYWVRKFFLSK